MTQPPQSGAPWQPPQAAPPSAPGMPYPARPQQPPGYPQGTPAHPAPPRPHAQEPYAPQQPYGQQPYAPPQPYGQQPYAPQQPYAQPGAPQGHPAPAGAWGGQPAVQCRFCGCVPAAPVTFRGHRGLIIMMQFLHVKGPFCRDCGLATFRDMTARTLVQGWYGYGSFFITPFTVLINLLRRGSVAALPAPTPPPDGRHGRPMDPGAPLLARPAALIGLALPFLVLGILIAFAATSSG
jgi:hypothetical protein